MNNKMYYCTQCGSWQFASLGTICQKCNSKIEPPQNVDEDYLPTEVLRSLKNEILGRNNNSVSAENNFKGEGQPKTDSVHIIKEDERLYREICKISADVNFIANVLRVSLVLCLLGFLIWIVIIAVNS